MSEKEETPKTKHSRFVERPAAKPEVKIEVVAKPISRGEAERMRQSFKRKIHHRGWCST